MERVDRLAAAEEKPVPVHADEGQIGAGFGEHDLADAGAVAGVDMHTVDVLAAERGGSPDIAVSIGPDAVVQAALQGDEDAPVGEHLRHCPARPRR